MILLALYSVVVIPGWECADLVPDRRVNSVNLLMVSCSC